MRPMRLFVISVLSLFVIAQVSLAQSDASNDLPGSDVTKVIEDASTKLADDNSVWIKDATGSAGGTASVSVMLSTDTDVHAIGLDISFDQTVLQLKSLDDNGVTVGSDASGLDIPALDDDLITAANSSGSITIYLLHLNVDPEVPLNKISAGAEKEVLDLRFTVDGEASVGDLSLGLANVEVATVNGDEAQTVDVTSAGGTLTISEFAEGDVSGDGNVNIFDLLALLGALKGETTTGPSDVNGDGNLNIFDLLALLQLL